MSNLLETYGLVKRYRIPVCARLDLSLTGLSPTTSDRYVRIERALLRPHRPRL